MGKCSSRASQRISSLRLRQEKAFDLSKPLFELERNDTEEMRKIILGIPYKKWKDLGFSKGTLHPLKQKAKKGKPFRINKDVKERLLEIG